MNLILGTANFGNEYRGKKLDKDLCFKILDRAKALGVWAVDTAQSYGESPKIIQEWNGGLSIFSKMKPGEDFPEYADWVLAHGLEEFSEDAWNKFDGVSIYELDDPHWGWVQAPFSPLNLTFLDYCHIDSFIARSIFLGGQVYGSADRKAIAKLTFGFLRSHDVKNVVFGVSSLDDLERVVEAANDTKTYDMRKL